MKRLVFGAVALASLLAGAVEVATEEELATALENATAGDEIAITADIAPVAGFTAAVPVTIRGVKQDGTPVVLNGEPNGAEVLLTLSSTDEHAGYLIENIVFTNAVTHGVKKTGGASATFKSCVFTANGRMAKVNGRGGNFAGYQPASILRFEKCLFLNNEDGWDGNNYMHSCSGMGAYINGFKRVEMVDTDFIGNGMLRTRHNKVVGRENGKGAAIYAQNAPITATNVRFIGNRAVGHSSYGGIVHLGDSGCAGSSFTNCLWLANSHVSYEFGSHAESGGAVHISLGNKTQTVHFTNCTIAYNLGAGSRTPGLNIEKGTAVIRNSILFGNMMTGAVKGNEAQGYASEIVLKGGDAILDIDYSLLPSRESPYIYCPVQYSSAMTFGDNMRYGDPLFATSVDDFLALIEGGATPALPATTPSDQYTFWFKDTVDLMTVDAHLRSAAGRKSGSGWVNDAVASPAIDAGDSSSDCSNEPEPNGDVVNLGFYGNTAEASKSPDSLTTLTIQTVTQEFANYTSPTFTVVLGESITYSANLWLCLGATPSAQEGTNGWQHVYLMSPNARPDADYTFDNTTYFEAGSTLYWRVVLATNKKSVSTDGSVNVPDNRPPAWGLGGGEEVIHLDSAARGDGSGRDWLNACTTLDAALALVTETRTNLWVCGTVLTAAFEPTTTRAVTVRGGFTGFENTPEDRADDTPNGVFDGDDESKDGLHLIHGEGVVLIERMTFQNLLAHGLYKTGAGDLAVRKCRFTATGSRINTCGCGIYATGNAGSSALDVADCVFEDLVVNLTNDAWPEQGIAFYVSNFKTARIANTRVARCGVPWNRPLCREQSRGMVFYVNSAPIEMDSCEFVGNRATQHNSNPFLLTGNCNGAAFRNCVFAGNLGLSYSAGRDLLNANDSKIRGLGLLRIDLSGTDQTVTFDQCTFAYNLVARDVTAGINVSSGSIIVRNSIFFGNVVPTECQNDTSNIGGYGADIYVAYNGRADVDWCAFQEKGLPCAGARLGEDSINNLTLGENIVTGDPKFVTVWSEVAGQIEGGVIDLPFSSERHCMFAQDYDPSTIDVHLRSKGGHWNRAAGKWRRDRETSPCIGAGNPDTPLGAQTAGKAVNLGAYGGTAEASQPYRTSLVFIVR